MSPKWRKLETSSIAKASRAAGLGGHSRLGRLDKLTHSRGVIALLVAADLLVGFAYLIQTNLTASAGYEISTWEKKVSKLEDENRKLSLQYIDLQSMDKLISGAASLSLVPVKNVETIAAETVAINR